MGDFHTILKTLRSTNKPCALVTIIHVDGASYRDVGTSMLFLNDGKRIGMLSGGCLENHLQDMIKQSIESQSPRVYQYDTTKEDMLNLGEGSGCPGTIDLFIQPLSKEKVSYLNKVNDYLSKGIRVRYMTELSTGKTLYFSDNQESFGDLNISTISYLNSNLENGITDYRGKTYFVYHYLPTPRLIIFGAGEDAKPLALFAQQMGMNVVVTDWRSELCQQNGFPKTIHIIEGRPLDVIDDLDIGEVDYIVVMTHHFNHDQQIIGRLVQVKPYYLGILSSKRRLSELVPNKDDYPFIYAPVGLSIDADGPYEIAISIIAQIVACIHKDSNTKRTVCYESI